MAEKRAYPDDGAAVGQGDAKRPRSNNGSPAPATNGAASGKPSIQEQIAAAKERAASLRASMGSAVSTPHSATASPSEAARAKIEAMKARVAAATKKAGPPPVASPSIPTYKPPEQEDAPLRARGGLGIGLHPALIGDSAQDGRAKNKSSMSSKFSTTMGNRRPQSPVSKPLAAGKKQLDLAGPTLEDLKKNPYFDASISAAAPKSRKARELVFNQKGKFMAQAQALRRQAHLEEMKRRIAESARKAGLDEDRSEQAFVVTAPPDVEWWDEGLLSTSSYPDFENDDLAAQSAVKIETDDSLVTRFIQHPALFPPPMEKNMPPPKPLPLTKTEQKKKRKQDRMEVHKEQQAKIRLGLEPPPAPKVKKSNLMRVLGEQAVKDPTAVEARVNREIAERAQAHVDDNQARKLTDEQRHEKLAAQQEGDAARGILCAVFRIDSLAYGKHRYQVDINAKQNALTGITILHPRLNLVIVEGGEKSMIKYKKLMLERIKWKEIGPNISNSEAPESRGKSGRDAMDKEWLKPEDADGNLRDMSENRCLLVWEGEEKKRAFTRWYSRVCETDGEAREALTRMKMENMWTRAKNMD